MRSDRAAGNWWAVQQHTEGTEQRPLAFSTLSLTLPPPPHLSLYLCLACLWLLPVSTTFLLTTTKKKFTFFSMPSFSSTAFFFYRTIFFSSVLLSLPSSLCESNGHVRCCATVFTKHKVFCIHPAPGIPDCSFVWEKASGREIKRKTTTVQCVFLILI